MNDNKRSIARKNAKKSHRYNSPYTETFKGCKNFLTQKSRDQYIKCTSKLKKESRQFGKINIQQNAFLNALKMNDN